MDHNPRLIHACPTPFTYEYYLECGCGFIDACANCEQSIRYHVGVKCAYSPGVFQQRSSSDYEVVRD